MAERLRVAAILSGRGSNMAALLYASRLRDCPYELCLVASNKPEAAGLSLAKAEGIETWALSHKGIAKADFEAALTATLEAAETDYVALCGFMRVLSPEFVERWSGRIVNIHPSLLPKYKGLDTHARAIDAGDPVAGCSVHLVTPELDDGPVLGQIEVAILPSDTPDTLAARVLHAEHQLYPAALSAYVARHLDADWLLEQVRDLALELPEAEEAPSHGSPAFKTKKGKFFAHFSDRHHGEERIALLVKTSGEDEMSALIGAEPDLYHRPAYYGASGWIGLRLDRKDTDWDHVASWLQSSWRRTASKSLTKLLDAADEF
ncbi:phosphoribosylglycinamide formyltransferase [Pacificimonas flava]|uniref:Phosphoribosylglycinamide formyltransferase n=2 Tax=Pacificimonas TaxID=1960290 RepID=A0A219B7M9_9SPHN|nr:MULTISPECIES: phosphoribosylglycinamide formyltransferase [Pacificimonas]MBZ6378551.1 phosphoribosylglycinamide formyltransferase [Pacificimonas aurantium]OWV34163.1 phosphoribosylglycinamide formyltransferase [Pacificimonas flava]